MDSDVTTENASGKRVFENPTRTGLALAAGAFLQGIEDNGQHVVFTLRDVPENFEERHRAGKIMVSTWDAERFIEQVVGLVRSQSRLRDRAQANRLAVAALVEKKPAAK